MKGLDQKKYIVQTRRKFDPIALGLSLVGLIGVVASVAMGASPQSYLDLRSIFVVVGGTLASILFQFDFGASFESLKLVLRSFLGTPGQHLVSSMSKLDQAILNDIALKDLKSSDHISGELLNDIVYMHTKGLLYEEIDEFVCSRVRDEFLARKVAVELMRKAGMIAPALGLFGTVIGLVGVLRSLSDPSQIGPSMSLALMTTAYGAALGSLVFTPLAGRLEHHNTIYLEYHEQLLAKVHILLKRGERNMNVVHRPKVQK